MMDGYYARYTSDGEDHGAPANRKKTLEGEEDDPAIAGTGSSPDKTDSKAPSTAAESVFSRWVFPAMKLELLKALSLDHSALERAADGTPLSWHKYKKAFESFEKLKQMTRENVPLAMRSKLWQEVTGGRNLVSTTPELYQDICDKLFGKGNDIPSELPTSVLSNEKDFVSYYLNPDGVVIVRKVLCVLAYLHPDVTVCPLIQPLAAIFLHFMDEDWCFACCSSLLTTKQRHLLDQTHIEVAVAAATFEDCASMEMKSVLKHVKSYILGDGSEQRGMLFPNWQRMIFDNLDFTILVRVVDCFIVEGNKVLYRVGLSLLEAFDEYAKQFKSVGCPTAHELENAIARHATCLQMTGNEMIKVSLKVRLVTKEINDASKMNLKLFKAGKIVLSKEDPTPALFSIDCNKLSDIITIPQWHVVYSWLPPRMQLRQVVLAFSTDTDGYNLKTLYNKVEEESETIVIIKTDENEVFGAYLSGSLSDRHDRGGGLGYFGNGETFVMRLHPKQDRFAWVGNPALVTVKTKKISANYIFVDYKPTPEKPSARLRRISQGVLRRSSSTSKYKVDPACAVQHSASARNFREYRTEMPRGASAHAPADSGSPAEGFQAQELVQMERNISISTDSLSCSRMNSQAEGEDEAGLQMPPLRHTSEREDPPKTPSASDMFIAGNDACLIVGGGGSVQALWIDGALERGRSGRCPTFDNPPLTDRTGGDFRCTRLEVFSFDH